MSKRRQLAVVLGAGFSGLYTALRLSDIYERVIVLEVRDTETTSVVQSGHVHAFLLSGYTELFRRFPQLVDKLKKQGVSDLDWNDDMHLRTPFGRGRSSPSRDRVMTFSRSLLDGCLRELVLEQSNIELRDRCRVDVLTYDAALNVVSSVIFSSFESNESETLVSDCVVDCLGRRSFAYRFIKGALGDVLEKTELSSFMTYYSMMFRSESKLPFQQASLSFDCGADMPFSGGMFLPIEGNSVMVSLALMSNDDGPKDVATFLELLRSGPFSGLDVSRLSKMVAVSGQPHVLRCPGNVLWHFERLSMPSNFFVIGDALSYTIPPMSMGMTRSIVGTELLMKLFETVRDPAEISRRFYSRYSAYAKRQLRLVQAFYDRYRLPGARGSLWCFLDRFLFFVFMKGATVSSGLHRFYWAFKNEQTVFNRWRI